MVEPTCAKLQKLKHEICQLKHVRCGNTGDNTSLEKRVNGEMWKMNLIFEHTARGTTQKKTV